MIKENRFGTWKCAPEDVLNVWYGDETSCGRHAAEAADEDADADDDSDADDDGVVGGGRRCGDDTTSP